MDLPLRPEAAVARPHQMLSSYHSLVHSIVPKDLLQTSPYQQLTIHRREGPLADLYQNGDSAVILIWVREIEKYTMHFLTFSWPLGLNAKPKEDYGSTIEPPLVG